MNDRPIDRSGTLLDAVVESSPIAMIVSDRDGVMRMVNREAEVLFGYTRQEMLGRRVEMLVPSPVRAVHANLRKAYCGHPRARRMGSSAEFCGLRKDGSEVPIVVGLNPIQTEHDLLFLSSIVDITDRKRLEADVRRAQADLERRVQERTAQLERSNREKESLLTNLRDQRAELERLSREDPLTGLSNRRDFDQRLGVEIQRAQRLAAPLTVAMLDLDRFKLINDRFGHAVGDAVLREVADLIRHQCRAIDGIARYGGEEFALALPGTSLYAGVVVCERIRVAFERFDWSRVHAGLALTISAGVSEWRPGLDGAALLAEADSALYEAKRHGRNRVIPPVE